MNHRDQNVPSIWEQLGVDLNRRGNVRCPFHEDTSPSLSIYRAPDGRERWKCHAGCGGGDAFELAQRLGNESPPPHFHPPRPSDRSRRSGSVVPPDRETPLETIVTALRGAGRDDQAREEAQSYLAGRFSITDDDGEGLRRLKELLETEAVFATPEELMWAGKPRRCGPIATPLFSIAERRVLDLCRRQTGSERPKTLRLKGAAKGRRVAFGLDANFERRLGETSIVVLAEGDTDSQALLAFTPFAVIGVPGNSCTVGVVEAALEDILPGGTKVIVAFDLDKSGKAATKKAVPVLLAAGCELGVWRASGFGPEDGVTDVTDFVSKLGWRELEPSLREVKFAKPSVGWKEPVPLNAGEVSSERSKLPVDALPDSARRFVTEVATALQVDTSLVAAGLLASASTLTARHLIIEPRRGWREPPNLFSLLVAEPGSRKSPLLRLLHAPFVAALEDRIRQEAIERGEIETRREQAEKRRRELIRRKPECLETEEIQTELTQISTELAELSNPSGPHLVANDITPEAALTLLARNSGHLLVGCAEGTFLDLIRGRYSSSGGVNTDVMLKGHAGDTILIHRKDRQEVILNPRLCLVLFVQPGRFAELLADERLSGRGLFARFLIAAPKSNLGHRDTAPPEVSSQSIDWWKDYVERRLSKAPDQPQILRFAPKAQEALAVLERRVEIELRPDGFFHGVRAFGAKFAGTTLRVAANLAQLEADYRNPIGEISLDIFRRAEQLAWWFANSYRDNLQRHVGGEHREKLQALLDWCADHTDGFSFAECRSANRALGRSKDLEELIGELIDFGYLRERPVPYSGVGRPPKPRYDTHPMIQRFRSSDRPN